jgi:hypothetical protein
LRILTRGVTLDNVREERLKETQAIIERTILVRRVTLGVFSLLALAVTGFPRFPFNPLFTVPFAWFLLTFPFGWLIRRQRSVRALHNVHAAFLSAEAVLVTYLVHRLGGVAWVGVLFYLFTVMYANFFLPKYAGYVVTALAVGGYALVALLEYFGILPTFSLFRAQSLPIGISPMFWPRFSWAGSASIAFWPSPCGHLPGFMSART